MSLPDLLFAGLADDAVKPYDYRYDEGFRYWTSDPLLQVRHDDTDPETEATMLDAYLAERFGVPAPQRPQPETPSTGKDDPNRDPDLHAGPRRDAEPDDGAVIDAYVRQRFPQLS